MSYELTPLSSLFLFDIIFSYVRFKEIMKLLTDKKDPEVFSMGEQMQYDEVIEKLESLSDPEAVKGMARFGINPDNSYGISIPSLQKVAKQIGKDHSLAGQLWASGVRDARILACMIDDPKFVHEMMAFATECIKEWWTERARFFGEDGLQPLLLGNDEVGIPWVSPALYEEFILPYETDLSEYFGGIDYWHSCGNCTALLASEMLPQC